MFAVVPSAGKLPLPPSRAVACSQCVRGDSSVNAVSLFLCHIVHGCQPSRVAVVILVAGKHVALGVSVQPRFVLNGGHGTRHRLRPVAPEQDEFDLGLLASGVNQLGEDLRL